MTGVSKSRLAVTRRDVLLALAGSITGCANRRGTSGTEAADPWARSVHIATGIGAPDIPPALFMIQGEPSGSADTDRRQTLQAAIDNAGAAGGGVVRVSPGRWFCDGPLKLRSRVNLELAAGSHLVFSGNPASYLPEVLTRWEGTELWTYSPMIFADGLADVAITGAGRIDGQGARHFLPWRDRQKPDQDALRQMGHDGVPVADRRFGEGHWLRPHFLQFRNCRRVLVEGVELVDSPFWVTHLLYCDHVVVRKIDVVSRHINSDGVDIDSSSNVLVENCRFDVGDDGVAIKSGRDRDGWRVGRPSRDIVIRNNEYVGNTGGAMAIGSEMSGGVTDVYVENYRLERAHHALYFKANLDRGGKIERVFIRNIDVGRVESLLIFTNDYHSYRGGNHPARFENVTVSRVRCREAGMGLSIVGHPRAPVRNVYVSDLAIDQARTPLQIAYVERLEFDRVFINGRELKAPARTPDETFERNLSH